MTELEAQNVPKTNEILSQIARKLIRTEGIREFALTIIHDELRNWSGDSRIKEKMSQSVEKTISKIMKATDKQGMEFAEDIGKLLTTWAQSINEERKRVSFTPIPQEELRKGPINDFIVNTDFGELKEMVEGSEDRVLQTIESINAAIWPYPAKIASLLAIIMAANNTSVKGINTLLEPLLKYLGPDLTADIMLSLVREIKGKEVGKLVNNLVEVVRRLHTGSFLLAKGGKPLFEIYLTNLLKEIVPEINPEVFTKALIALSEDAETVAKSLAEALSENEAMLLTLISAYASLKNPKIRAATLKMRLLEDVDAGKLTDAIAKGVVDLDTQEMAELVNAKLRIANLIHENKPELFSNLFRGFADSIDTDELEKAARWVVPELIDAIKPLGKAVVPSLINGFCELVRSDEGSEMKKALENLRTTLLASGGGK
jgi:sulfur transfer complex TusBCD TusB component (DsrH family)